MAKKDMDAPRGKGDYEVGKGKPPKAHQFKKGQSGNPAGRPPKRGGREFDDLFRRLDRLKGKSR